jgi:hypothetical protein
MLSWKGEAKVSIYVLAAGPTRALDMLTADVGGKCQVLADPAEVAVSANEEVAVPAPRVFSQHMLHPDGRWK